MTLKQRIASIVSGQIAGQRVAWKHTHGPLKVPFCEHCKTMRAHGFRFTKRAPRWCPMPRQRLYIRHIDGKPSLRWTLRYRLRIFFWNTLLRH